MCGIAGVLTNDPSRGQSAVERMIGKLRHRGPDDEGTWNDKEAGIHLGHRRLAILDLGPSGHQPMTSQDSRYVVTYNGEIYNHAQLRRELDETEMASPGRVWRGKSDTETLVECISRWGLLKTLKKCVGMFAFALWDRKDRKLFLVRDRFGEKPLYYGWVKGDFVFASELKSIRAHPDFSNEIDLASLRLFTARAYIPAPRSIYRNIHKLIPGCILTISARGGVPKQVEPPLPDTAQPAIRSDRYWSYRETVLDGLAHPISSEDEALELLQETLENAILGQSIADVPVGAFLSGGIDSSSVVALYQRLSNRQVHTFSLGFEEAGYNEANFAKSVATHLCTSHREQYVTVREALEVIPKLPSIYDEPFGDPSQIPTYLVSQFARQHVTVSLSGDGGDELFGGYNRYIGFANLWSKIECLPADARAAAAGLLGRTRPSTWSWIAENVTGTKRSLDFGTKIQKGLRAMARAKSLEDVFERFVGEWPGGASPVLADDRSLDRFDLDLGPGAANAIRMMYCDALSYLPDDILCKVDRAAMAVSLETRIPFLDHRVSEVSARIPLRMKISNGQGKQILRQLLFKEAPEKLFRRPKAGFSIPVGDWIRGPLRDWAEDLLSHRRLTQEGFFDPDIVRRCWHQHLTKQSDCTSAIWSVLMFQAWYAENGVVH